MKTAQIDILPKILASQYEMELLRGIKMTTDTIVIKLTSEDVLNLTRILIDNDKEEALQFLKQCLKPQLDQSTRGRLVRSFEAP